MSPGVPQLGKAVAEDDRPALAELDGVQLDTIYGHLAVNQMRQSAISSAQPFSRVRALDKPVPRLRMLPSAALLSSR